MEAKSVVLHSFVRLYLVKHKMCMEAFDNTQLCVSNVLTVCDPGIYRTSFLASKVSSCLDCFVAHHLFPPYLVVLLR